MSLSRTAVLRLFLFFSALLVPAAHAALNPCIRYQPGSSLVEPADLFSVHGVLNVSLTYRTETDQYGNTLYCFVTSDGHQSPTLHVSPGDELLITLKNAVPPSDSPMAMAMPGSQPARQSAMPGLAVTAAGGQTCGDMLMTSTSTNMHFHGTNVPPTCHQDEVIHTMINSGETFQYDVHIPLDEPPGLYWYHPHIHGSSEAAVQGGASGALIVEGIQDYAPEVANLPARTVIVRDNLVPSAAGDPDGDGDSDTPAWDVSVNYIPVASPGYTPAVIPMRPRQKQFWRVLNASADTILDLQVQYDGSPQVLAIVALDGVPTGSQDGAIGGKALPLTHILIPPAGRAEFIVTAPDLGVKTAQLVTLNIDTGPDGDNDPPRPLANIATSRNAVNPSLQIPPPSGTPVARSRFHSLAVLQPIIHRRLYFSEVLSDPSDPNSPTNFYITVDGQKPRLFSPDNPPAIVTTQGAVEDWTIENRALENHEFHIHQIHFLVLQRNGLDVDKQYLDTINVPYWSGTGPYPNVKLRMDFRGDVVGDFVYHCHILGHEDSGMMAVIRVLPRP